MNNNNVLLDISFILQFLQIRLFFHGSIDQNQTTDWPVGWPASSLFICLFVLLIYFFFHRPFKTNTFNRSKLEFLYLNLSFIYRIECSFDSIQLIRFTRILFVLLRKLNWIFFSSFFFAKHFHHHTTHLFNRLSTGLIFFWICLFICVFWLDFLFFGYFFLFS